MKSHMLCSLLISVGIFSACNDDPGLNCRPGTRSACLSHFPCRAMHECRNSGLSWTDCECPEVPDVGTYESVECVHPVSVCTEEGCEDANYGYPETEGDVVTFNKGAKQELVFVVVGGELISATHIVNKKSEELTATINGNVITVELNETKTLQVCL